MSTPCTCGNPLHATLTPEAARIHKLKAEIDKTAQNTNTIRDVNTKHNYAAFDLAMDTLLKSVEATLPQRDDVWMHFVHLRGEEKIITDVVNHYQLQINKLYPDFRHHIDINATGYTGHYNVTLRWTWKPIIQK